MVVPEEPDYLTIFSEVYSTSGTSRHDPLLVHSKVKCVPDIQTVHHLHWIESGKLQCALWSHELRLTQIAHTPPGRMFVRVECSRRQASQGTGKRVYRLVTIPSPSEKMLQTNRGLHPLGVFTVLLGCGCNRYSVPLGLRNIKSNMI